MPFQIIRNDITKVAADAIVNTANPEPVYGGGTDSAIYQAAGVQELLKERRQIGTIRPGEAAVTPAFRLQARFIIHTVGPAWQGGDHGEYDALASCYRKSLLLARQLGCESIAFPLISTGVYGFPKDRALDIALQTIADFLNENDMDVTLVVFDKKAFDLSSSLVAQVSQFIDDNYVQAARQEEYSRDEMDGRNRRGYGAYARRAEATMPSAAPAPSAPMPSTAPAPSAPMPSASMPSAASSEKPEKSPLRQRIFKKKTALEDTATLPPLSEAAFPAPQADALAEEGQSAPQADAFSEAAFPAPQADTFSGIDLSDALDHMGETFQERLLHLIDERDLTDAQVYKKANVDRKLFSKIRCNPLYHPHKQTAVALAVALELGLEDTRDLLQRAGLAFSPSSKFDLIVEYCIENGIYDIYEINALLFKFDQPMLGY